MKKQFEIPAQKITHNQLLDVLITGTAHFYSLDVRMNSNERISLNSVQMHEAMASVLQNYNRGLITCNNFQQKVIAALLDYTHVIERPVKAEGG